MLTAETAILFELEPVRIVLLVFERIVVPLLAFGASESAVTQVTAIIAAGSAVVAYIIGEGLVDACGRENTD